MKKGRKKFFYSIFLAVLAGTAGWAFYSLINNVFTDVLNKVGVVNENIQLCIIVVFVFTILIVFGYKAKQSLEKIIR